MLTKKQQLKYNKPKKDLTEAEKTKYFTWIKENKTCVVCEKYPGIHHITNKSIKGARRLHTRVVPLCFLCHSAQSVCLSVHGATDDFYEKVRSLEQLLEDSKKMYEEYLDDSA